MITFPTPLPTWLTVKKFPTYPKWELVRVGYYQENDGSGNWNASVNIYIKVLNQNGNYQEGVKVWQAFPTDKASALTRKKGDLDYGATKEPFGVAFEMSPNSIFYPDKGQSGPYFVYVDGNSDELHGCGLPVARHNQFVGVWQWLLAPIIPPPPPPHETLEAQVLQIAGTYPWMPVNNGGALWKFAKANDLQDQQTDEHRFMWQARDYTFQVFNLGIVYAQTGDWSNIQIIRK